MGLVNLIPARVVRAAGDASVVAIADDHTLTVALPPRVADGDPVQLAVRPESVHVAPLAPGHSAAPGEVRARSPR
jgi:hypothetical protein